MAKVSNEISGDNNVVQNGNGNIYIDFSRKRPTPTEIYRLLEVFVQLDIQVDDDYELKSPAELNTKLKYNHAVKHMLLFEDYADVYTSVDIVLSSSFQDSEKVDLKLKRLYLQNDKVLALDNGEILVENGDAVLTDLTESLLTSIKNDPSIYEGTDITEEKMELFVVGLLMRGISMCKVLQPPKDLGEDF